MSTHRLETMDFKKRYSVLHVWKKGQKKEKGYHGNYTYSTRVNSVETYFYDQDSVNSENTSNFQKFI